jgi:hypothetical protein
MLTLSFTHSTPHLIKMHIQNVSTERHASTSGESPRRGISHGPWVVAAAIILGQATGASAQIVPPERLVTWQGNAGVSGGIPNRTAVCATLNPIGGSSNDTAAIQGALNACPQGGVVKLGPGTFRVSQINITRSNVSLRGSGRGTTVLKGISTSAPYIVGVNQSSRDWDLNAEQTFNLSAGYTKGSTTIGTSSPHNWVAGDLILIDQANNLSGNPPITSTGVGGLCQWCGRWGGNKPAGQVVKVVAVPSATSAQLEIPLYWTFAAATVQGTRLPGVVSGVGIEDLTVDNTASWNDGQQNAGTIGFYFAQNSWVLRTEVYGVAREAIGLYVSYRNTIRSSVLHRSMRYTSNNGYGIFMMPATSATVIEDNEIFDLAVGFAFAGVNSGNVVAYNYVTGLKDSRFPNAVRSAVDYHGAHPFMNLIEGNFFDGPSATADSYWGSSSHNTYLRNRVAIDVSKASEAGNMRFMKANWYFNIVGNVLGTVGNETRYEGDDPYSYKLVYELDSSSGYLGAPDGQTRATILRHGNWDSFNNRVMWDPSRSDRTIPNSYYLPGKPAFFGTCSWPAIGPDLSPMTGTLPAYSRHLGSDACGGGSTAGLPSPTNLRVLQ